MIRFRDVAVGALVAAVLLAPCAHASEPGWGYYGGDAGGQRFSPARQITPANVATLTQAWSFSTGDMATKGDVMKRASFENTPILADGRLYVCSPFNEVSALDPLTFGSVPVLMAMVAVMAAWIPARRAAGVDPMEALRAD